MFGKIIWLPKCQVTSSRCEDLILLRFYLQMLNNINVKKLWDSLKCKYCLKQITKTRVKNVATNKNCILRKIGLKFQNPSYNTSCKTAFWNKQKRLNKEFIIWSGLSKEKSSLFDRTALRNDKFSFPRKFLIAWNRTCLHLPSPVSSVSILAYLNIMSIQMGQPVGGRILF